MLKKVKNIVFLLILPLVFLGFTQSVVAEEAPRPTLYDEVSPEGQNDILKMYFFYGNGCPHCAKEEIFLDKLENEYEDIEISRFEVWGNRENAELLSKVSKELNLTQSGVPVLIIGDEAFIGYYDDETTGNRIETAIIKYLESGCDDIVGSVIDSGSIDSGQCAHGCDGSKEECPHDCGCQADAIKGQDIPETLNIPIIGEIKTKNLSLPVFTIIIAALDGFNPCAMWVLLFLISLLLGMKDKKKMWILGAAFIASSAAVYFLFLSAWLNLFLFLGFVIWIRFGVGVVAIASGSYHLKEWRDNKDGVCKVSGGNKKKVIFDKLKKIILEKKFLFSLVGIIILAAVVNLVELVCSAGLPAVYTQVLIMSDLPSWQYYSYLVLYIFIFMLDDLLVFSIAMITLQEKMMTAKYSRWSNLIGGIIMLVIGILLIFKPGWLMFG